MEFLVKTSELRKKKEVKKLGLPGLAISVI